MSRIIDFYRIPTTSAPTVTQVVSDNIGTGASCVVGGAELATTLVQGTGTRLSKYKEWELMDVSVEVSRALDTIAQHMAGKDSITKLPVVIELSQSEIEQIPANVTATLKTVLRHWASNLRLDTRMFNICRSLVKYGDVFFKRNGLNSPWVHVPARDVVAAIVSEQNPLEIIAWQIQVRGNTQSMGSFNLPTGVKQDQEIMVEIVPAQDIIRFTTCDDMGDEAPFGKSVLAPVLRVYKQKELLETAILIYRIQRAPERRVFYIDTGKLPPGRQEAMLERIRNEIRQARTVTKQSDEMDTVYNPHSMMEDIFLAQSGDGKGHKVETLPGGQGLGELTDLEYFEDLLLRGLRVPVAWMKPGSNNAMLNDTRAGQAFVEEQQFIQHVENLQTHVNCVLDAEFKRYVAYCGLNIDPTCYTIALVTPNNFDHYKKAALDTELLNNFNNIKDVAYISPRFAMSRFLQMTDDEIATNEMMRRQELGLSPLGGPGDYSVIYGIESADGAAFDSAMGGGGGFGGGLGAGGDLGDGMDTDPSDVSDDSSDLGDTTDDTTSGDIPPESKKD